MEWNIIKNDTPHNEVLEMVKDCPDKMLVKAFKDNMGICLHCAACGAWLK